MDFHEKGDIDDDSKDAKEGLKYEDGVNALLYDIFRGVKREGISDGSTINVRKFYNLLKEDD